jgi:hypothetical protein
LTLRVDDFDGPHEANSVSALEIILAKRYNEDSNSFWLSHGNKRHPALALLVKGNLAGMHYFPKDSHPGFVPTGTLVGLPSGEQTTFYLGKGGAEIQVVHNAIVPFPSHWLWQRNSLVQRSCPNQSSGLSFEPSDGGRRAHPPLLSRALATKSLLAEGDANHPSLNSQAMASTRL